MTSSGKQELVGRRERTNLKAPVGRLGQSSAVFVVRATFSVDMGMPYRVVDQNVGKREKRF